MIKLFSNENTLRFIIQRLPVLREPVLLHQIKQIQRIRTGFIKGFDTGIGSKPILLNLLTSCLRYYDTDIGDVTNTGIIVYSN